MNQVKPWLMIRERSRSARERSRNLRVTSQQLRESLEHLCAYAAGVNSGSFGSRALAPPATEPSTSAPRNQLDFATLVLQRVRKAREEARILRQRAAILRRQAAGFRADSEDARSASAHLR